MHLSRFALILSCSLLAGAGSAFGQEPPNHPPGGPSYPHLVLIDLRDVLESPLSWQSRQWELFGLSVAGIGAVGLLDGRIRDAEARDHNHVVDQVTHYAEQMGNGGAVGVLGVFYLASLATGDQRSRWVAEDGVAASIIAGVILDPAIKVIAGRRRPRDATRTYDFKLFGGGQSFPSGHSTEAFTLASVIASEYDSMWIKGVSYGGAAIVGFARVHHRAHFASDVTAGAILGTAVGRTVVRINRTERGKLAFAPVSGPHGEPGMAVVIGF
ncbi:MAG TPA: phosphatase PAP2 family protein [Thermoanaerobaculia bacterium]|jgi:membrane-associated phospholipid phosphatase|nr:phosphatase PAP2 family protein [Thermoanaerobaculia bacterium]